MTRRTDQFHVGVVLTNYPPHVGGVEKHAEALSHALVGQGHRVTVVCLGDTASSDERAGAVVRTLRRRLDIGGVLAVPEPAAWRRATRVLAAADLTHIAVHTRFFPMTWLGLRLARTLGLPSVLTEHGGGPVATHSRPVNTAARAIDATSGRHALRSATAVLAVSRRSAAFVESLSGRRPEILGNGADANFWATGRTGATRRHVTFAGRLVPEKGWRTALDCVAAQDRDVTATFAGAGPDAAELAAEVAARGLSERVELAGRLDPVELRDRYRGSVYVNPSTAAEGFQTTLLEAGLAGARIATYDVGGAAEVVGSGAAPGRIVPSGDQAGLRRAVRDLVPGTERGRPALLEEYDWQMLARRYETVLAGLPSRAGHR